MSNLKYCLGVAIAWSVGVFASPAAAQVSGIDAYRTSLAPAVNQPYLTIDEAASRSPRSRQQQALTKALAALDRREFGHAAKLLDGYVRRGRNPDAQYLSAVAHSGLGQYSRARGLFADALVGQSDHLGARLGLALTEIRLGRHAEAASSLAIIEQRRQKCGGECPDAATLERAASLIGQFLSQAPTG